MKAFVSPLAKPSRLTASGGVKVVCKPGIGEHVSIWKQDIDWHFLWLKIQTPEQALPTFIGVVYIPPGHARSFTHKTVSKTTAFSPVKDDILHIKNKYPWSDIFILGNLN